MIRNFLLCLSLTLSNSTSMILRKLSERAKWKRSALASWCNIWFSNCETMPSRDKFSPLNHIAPERAKLRYCWQFLSSRPPLCARQLQPSLFQLRRMNRRLVLHFLPNCNVRKGANFIYFMSEFYLRVAREMFVSFIITTIKSLRDRSRECV